MQQEWRSVIPAPPLLDQKGDAVATSEMAIKDRVTRLTEDYEYDRNSLLELLLFWRRYPSARFNLLAITCALRQGRQCMERALSYLTKRGVVREVRENDVRLYSLSDDNEIRLEVLALTELAGVKSVWCSHKPSYVTGCQPG